MNKPFTITFLTILCIFVSIPLHAFDEESFLTEYYWNKFVTLKPPHRPKIAVVLSGGGARGLAHIGVLKVLEEENIPVDVIVGTSVGALIGALYAANVPIERIENMAQTIGWDDLINVSGPALVKLLVANRLLSTEKMEKYLKKNIGNVRFDELKIPFACVATDIITGEKIIFREGDVVPAARASATIPGVFEPVEYRHRFLVDGGLLDNIPVDVAKLLGADFIVVVTVSGDFSNKRMSNVFMVLNQSIIIQGKQFDENNLKSADFIIHPHVGDISTIDLGYSERCVDAGITASVQAMTELKRNLLQRTTDAHLFQ